MTGPKATRRGVLAATGATLLAGCSGLDSASENDERLNVIELQRVVPDGPDEPLVAESLPVEIERSVLAGSVARVTELVESVPTPFGPESLPNGHIRHRLTEAAHTATEKLAAARTAPSRFVALSELRRARAEARYAAAGWAFVDDGLTEDQLWNEHQRIRNDAQSTRNDLTYLGTDPVTAALVYGQVEELLDSVLDEGRTPGRYETSQLLTVAEWGDHVETAQVQLDDARYLYDRFQSSLSAEATSVDGVLSGASDTLRDELERREAELPPEPDDDNAVRWRLYDRIGRTAESSVERVEAAPGPASSLLVATRGLTGLLAADRLGDRIQDDEKFHAETVAEVRAVRTAATDAITTALDESPRADLARPMLAEAARSVAYADDRLSRFDRNVRPSRLDDTVARYWAATLRARSVPAACRTTLDALGG